MKIQNAGSARLAAGLLLALLTPMAAQAADEPLSLTIPVPGPLENQEMRIIELTLAPGQASMPHRHNAHTFVYVLEGEVEMQVRGGPLMRLGPGETFYETPTDIHQVSRNPSATTSAKILIHMLKAVGAPVTVPAE
jgi:quercetin dioxygenase-like cupin family protein